MYVYNLFNKYKYYQIISVIIYNLFLKDIDETIDCEISTHKNIRDRTYTLVNEYMEIYKHSIQEILSLGYVLVTKPSIKVMIIIHLLNLFITKIEDNIHNKRILIILFIIKALSCTSKNGTNFITNARKVYKQTL